MFVYNSKNVNVIVDGMIVTGFSSDSVVNCARNEDRAVPYYGVKGEFASSTNNNTSGTITLTLQQNSPFNAILQRYSNESKVFPMSVIDSNSEGGFIAGGNNCQVLSEPDNERGAEIGERDWNIFVYDYTNDPQDSSGTSGIGGTVSATTIG